MSEPIGTDERLDRIEELEAEIKLHEECATIVHFQGVRYARDNMADAVWAEFKDKWEGERKYALRKVVAFLRGQKNTPGGGTPEAVSRHRADGSGDSD
jgi:hypothetical protein